MDRIQELEKQLLEEATKFNALMSLSVAALLRINELKELPLDTPVSFSEEDLNEIFMAKLGLRSRPLDHGGGLSFQVSPISELEADANASCN